MLRAGCVVLEERKRPCEHGGPGRMRGGPHRGRWNLLTTGAQRAKGNGRGERTGDGRGDRTGRSRATGASDGVEYDVSDDVHYGACVDVLQVVRCSPSGGAFTRQVLADRHAFEVRRACVRFSPAVGLCARPHSAAADPSWSYTHDLACMRPYTTGAGHQGAPPGGGSRRRDRHRRVWRFLSHCFHPNRFLIN